MGYDGQWEHPEVVKAMENVIEIAMDKGVATAPASTISSAPRPWQKLLCTSGRINDANKCEIGNRRRVFR